MTQDKDLKVLGGIAAGELGEELDGAALSEYLHPTRSLGAGQVMNGRSCAGMMTMGRIMSRSSCSRMWQWYM